MNTYLLEITLPKHAPQVSSLPGKIAVALAEPKDIVVYWQKERVNGAAKVLPFEIHAKTEISDSFQSPLTAILSVEFKIAPSEIGISLLALPSKKEKFGGIGW